MKIGRTVLEELGNKQRDFYILEDYENIARMQKFKIWHYNGIR